MLKLFIVAFCFCFLSACTKAEVHAVFVPSLSWENLKNPERKEWSDFLYAQLEEKFAIYDAAKDAPRFCPQYYSLSRDKRIHVWAEMLVWVMYYESAWKPTTWMIEKDQGIDVITKRAVRSEGLMQLSYQDTKWAKTCKFDWEVDKRLPENDPRRTIFNPFLNMQCGIDILGRQITRRGNVLLTKNVYWSVLRDNSKVKRITDRTRALAFCQ